MQNGSRIKPCPHCHDAWMYVSDGGYTSGYESYGYRIEVRFVERDLIYTRGLAEFFANKMQKESLKYEHGFTKNS